MINVQQLLATLHRADIVLVATNDDMLLIDGPKGILAPDLCHLITKNKSEIVTFLKAKNDFYAWYKIVDTIAKPYGLSVLELLKYDTDGINNLVGNTAAIEALCKSLADTSGSWQKHCAPSLLPVKPTTNNFLVKCINCQFFIKDTVGSGEGIGHCTAGKVLKYPEFPLYPNVERKCNLYCSKQENNKP